MYCLLKLIHSMLRVALCTFEPSTIYFQTLPTTDSAQGWDTHLPFGRMIGFFHCRIARQLCVPATPLIREEVDNMVAWDRRRQCSVYDLKIASANRTESYTLTLPMMLMVVGSRNTPKYLLHILYLQLSRRVWARICVLLSVLTYTIDQERTMEEPRQIECRAL